jgi:uncharacterized protein YjbI with pentapeptide repeats
MDESKNENLQIFLTIILFSITVVLLNLYLFYLIPNNDIFRRAVGAFFGSILGIIISYQAIIKKEKKYVWIWNLFVYIVSVQGTKFHRSNLDNASFVNANIKGSSFVECTVMRTNWEGVKKIDCSRIHVHYLDNPKIRYLLIQKQVGQDKDYQNMDLRGLNLVNANLNKANLSKADLSNSQLMKAKLENSILSQTRLDNADLSGANITGATIEIKSIPATAQLDGLICNFFYPQSNPTQFYPNSSNKKLTSEEAIKLLQKPLQINVTFKQDGIDWQAFLQAFEKCLQEFNITSQNSGKLIQAFETKSNGDFVIRLNVPDNVDQVEFEHKLTQAYKDSLEDLKTKYRNTLKTENIDFQKNASMLKITKQLANPGSIIIHNHNYNFQHQGDSSMDQRNIDTGGGNYNERIQGNYIQGNFHAEGQPQNLAEAAAKIQELLKELEQTYPTTTTSQQMVVAAEAINRIETQPKLKRCIINATKEGSLAAFEKAIDNPAGAFIVGAIKGWQEVEAED